MSKVQIRSFNIKKEWLGCFTPGKRYDWTPYVFLVSDDLGYAIDDNGERKTICLIDSKYLTNANWDVIKVHNVRDNIDGLFHIIAKIGLIVLWIVLMVYIGQRL